MFTSRLSTRRYIWLGCRCDMRPSSRYSRMISLTDYRPSDKRSISAEEMYSTICIEWAGNDDLDLTQIDPLLTKICAKSDYHIFVPTYLDLRPLQFKFALLVTLVRRYVSSKLEASKAFLLWENQGHGSTDRQTNGVQHWPHCGKLLSLEPTNMSSFFQDPPSRSRENRKVNE